MARYSFLILSIVLLTGCAQVGRLTGGEKDTFSPSPIESETSPPNRSTNFSGKEVSFLFDEFIRLDNPTQNIVMIPPHAKIKTEVKGKKLSLSWDEDLKPNTTYSIYLKEAVQDITESNDSIIQYVFSTGSQIDSLDFSCFVLDAFTGEPKGKMLVALFDPETQEILNFAETNAKGWAKLNNLKKQEYLLLSFDDLNKNLSYEINEGIAFKEDGVLTLSQSMVDSIPFLFSTSAPEPKIRTFKYLGRGRFVIGATSEFIDESIYLNGELIKNSSLKIIDKDSLLMYVPEVKTGSYELVVHSESLTDTVSLRVNEPKILPAFAIYGKGVISPKDSVLFTINDRINDIDKSRIHLFNPQDSTEISDFNAGWMHDELYLNFDRRSISKLVVVIDSGAISCSYGTNHNFKSNIEFNPARKYGNIEIDISAYNGAPILIELLRGNKAVASRYCEEKDNKTFFELCEPGEYTVRVINDVNKNQKWDSGDFDKKIQPEVVDRYSKVIQLRANWDVSVPLVPVR